MLLPLVRRKEGALSRIEWADLGITDYAAPLIAAGCPCSTASVRVLFAALQRSLPSADILSLAKMPEQIEGRWNPLAGLRSVQSSALFGNVVVIGDDLEAWRSGLDRRQRKGLDRVWRVFTRHEGARFDVIEDRQQAMQVLTALERYQARTIEGKGWNYVLDQPQYQQFYRELLGKGLADGSVILTALRAGDEVVAALLGLWHEDTCAVLRIARGDEQWDHCSPGRLLIDRTIAELHPRGLRKLDLTIGDYRFKREFKPQVLPLCEMSVPLSWRGVVQVSMSRGRRALRQMIDDLMRPASEVVPGETDSGETEAPQALCHEAAATDLRPAVK
jgi:CelD/BcsL family acetyltransferase involved in cellulose biosynthesis